MKSTWIRLKSNFLKDLFFSSLPPQESKLYYDADLGCYYQYDFENKKYSVHSRVKLPEFEAAKKGGRRSESPEYIGKKTRVCGESKTLTSSMT